MNNIERKKIKSILIIKLRGIGDVVLSSIVLKNLREDFPDARIDFLTEMPSQKILEPLPYLDNIILFPRRSLWERIKLFFKIRLTKYDLIMDFFSNPSTAELTFFSGARYRFGFPFRWRMYAYNLFGSSERDKFHGAELHLESLRLIGLTASHKDLVIGLEQEDKEKAKIIFEKFSLKEKLVAGICPSGGWQSKKCDPSKFAEIADEISKQFGAKIIILWGPGDKLEAEEIHRKMKTEAYFAPATDIRELAALIGECSILVANDSGPMHISTAVGTPVLSLHGPTNPMLQGPYGAKHEWIRLEELECINCNLLECPKKHECFLDLPLERIIKKVEILLSKNKLISTEENEEN